MNLGRLGWQLNELYQRRWLGMPLERRRAIGVGSATVGVIMLSFSIYWLTRGGGGKAYVADPEVVLYTSADPPLIDAVVKEFEGETGVKVRVVGDSEATKTTGLVQRLIAEKDRPRADVWWSSEAMGTVALAEAQILEPFASSAEREIPGGWPAHLRGGDRTWYGFGQRARVIVFNSNVIPKSSAPRTLRELVEPRYLGKVGIARPQFGTTRSHIAAIVALHGRDQARAWLEALKANQVRVYDGNSSVVKGVADGEIQVGLTDTDDVWAGQANGWPVDCVFEAEDGPKVRAKGLPSVGAIVLPNTVGRIKGGPNPTSSARLADFLLSAKVERLLAESSSRNIPVRPELAKAFKSLAVPVPAPVSAQQMSESAKVADGLIAEFFPVE